MYCSILSYCNNYVTELYISCGSRPGYSPPPANIMSVFCCCFLQSPHSIHTLKTPWFHYFVLFIFVKSSNSENILTTKWLELWYLIIGNTTVFTIMMALFSLLLSPNVGLLQFIYINTKEWVLFILFQMCSFRWGTWCSSTSSNGDNHYRSKLWCLQDTGTSLKHLLC